MNDVKGNKPGVPNVFCADEMPSNPEDALPLSITQKQGNVLTKFAMSYKSSSLVLTYKDRRV